MARTLLCTLVALVFPLCTSAHATLMNYSVSGAGLLGESPVTISGNIVIDDVLKNWSTGEPAPSVLEPSYYAYDFPTLSLTFTDTVTPSNSYSFNKSFDNKRVSKDPISSIFMHPFIDESGIVTGLFADEWFLNHGVANAGDTLNNWGSGVNFYSADYTPITSYGTPGEQIALAPIIEFSYDESQYSWYHDGSGITVQKMWLLQSGPAKPAPVPEPATILLFITGLAGTAGVKLRKRS